MTDIIQRDDCPLPILERPHQHGLLTSTPAQWDWRIALQQPLGIILGLTMPYQNRLYHAVSSRAAVESIFSTPLRRDATSCQIRSCTVVGWAEASILLRYGNRIAAKMAATRSR